MDIDSKMDEYLGNMGVSMDGRFSSIRTMETNLGIYYCSPMQTVTTNDTIAFDNKPEIL